MSRMTKWDRLAVLTVVLADLATKAWANADPPLKRTGPLSFSLVHNRGVSLGMLAGSPSLALLAAGAGLGALLWITQRTIDPRTRLALAIAAGGGLGNLADRLIHGAVTDWIHITGYGPTFNLADVAIRVGLLVALLAYIAAKRSPLVPTTAGETP